MSGMEERLNEVFKALSHPVRRAILSELSAGERRYSELMKAAGVDSATLSFHLRALGGLIEGGGGRYRLTRVGRAAASLMEALDERDELETYRRVVTGLALGFAVAGLVMMVGALLLDYPPPKLSFQLGLTFLTLPLWLNRRVLLARRRSPTLNLTLLVIALLLYAVVLPAISTFVF